MQFLCPWASFLPIPLITHCLPTHTHPALGSQGPFGEAHVLLHKHTHLILLKQTLTACVKVPGISSTECLIHLFLHIIIPMGSPYQN